MCADARARTALVVEDEVLVRCLIELNGWDVAEAARKADPEVHVIYTSGNATNLSRKVERSRFFAKPYDADQVVAACHKFVGHTPTH